MDPNKTIDSRTASCLTKIIPLPLIALRTGAGTATLSVITRWGSMGEFEKGTKSGSITEEESPLRRALTFNARAKRTARSHRRRSAVADILHHLHQTTLPIAVTRYAIIKNCAPNAIKLKHHKCDFCTNRSDNI